MDVQEYVGEDGNLVQDGQELIILLGSGTKKTSSQTLQKHKGFVKSTSVGKNLTKKIDRSRKN